MCRAVIVREKRRALSWHHEEDRLAHLPQTLATLLTASDENTKTTQKLMRHANAGIPMNLYAQALTRAKRAAHLKVAEMIRPTAEAASVPLCSRAEEEESVSA